MLARASIVGLWALCGLVPTSFAQIQTVTFDDIPPGPIGDQYFARGIRFFQGNGAFGTSTGPRLVDGQPVSASVGSFGTSITQPNVLVPGPGSNDDLWMYFYDSHGERSTVISFGVSNDREGIPALLYLDAYDAQGNFLVRSEINGPSAANNALFPEIAAARISAAPGQFGYMGVDDFIFCPTPEITGQPIDRRMCDHGMAVFSVEMYRGANTYFWQAASSDPDMWTDLRDGPIVVDGMNVGEISGARTSSIRIRANGADGGTFAGLIRAIVSTPCGAVASLPAPLRICAGDYNCDGGIDGLDVGVFIRDWSDGGVDADINGDGGVDGSDVSLFIQRWEAGC